MQLVSSAFTQGGEIPRLYTCQGEDIPPPLEILQVPEEAKSLILIMDDPDVPLSIRKDGMWVHWVLYDIPPKEKHVKENSGVLGRNTAGKNRYMGPCPPDRKHRYFFKLYALDRLLGFSEGKSKEELLTAIEGKVLAQAELMGVYEKSP